MEKVDQDGHVIGFSIMKVSFRETQNGCFKNIEVGGLCRRRGRDDHDRHE
jgi:hypothetical protein